MRTICAYFQILQDRCFVIISFVGEKKWWAVAILTAAGFKTRGAKHDNV